MGLDGLRHAAESREGQAARLVGRNALTLEFLCGFGDVRVDFGTELPLTSGVAANQTAQAREKDSQGGHDGSSWILKNRATMPVACCQAASSAARCLRPALVSA